MRCVVYFMQNFRINVVIVYDGYPQKPTTKDHARRSRAQSNGIGPDVQMTAIAKLSIKKQTRYCKFVF